MKKIMKPLFSVMMMTVAAYGSLTDDNFFPLKMKGKGVFCLFLFYLIDFPRKYFAVNILCLSLSRKSIFLVVVI